MIVDVKVLSNKDELLAAAPEAIERALTEVGIQAEGYAKETIVSESRVDTGELLNSIAYAVDVDEKAVYIGSNLEYAVYHEVGTGVYAEGGGGRKTPWAYTDRHGDLYWTIGIKPIHMLKKAASEHDEVYKAIIEEALKG